VNRRDRRAAQQKSRRAGSNQPSIDALLAQAVRHHQTGNLTAAKDAYQRILSTQPDNADALHLLGLVHHHQGDHEEALNLIGRAIELAPSIALFHNSLSAALRGVGRETDAIAALQRAIALNPEYAEARAGLGDVLAHLGQIKDAITAFKGAIQYAPHDADIHGALGGLYLAIQDISQAGHHFREAARLAPNSPEARFNLANVLFQEGDREASVSALRQTIAIEPAHAPAYERLGALLRDLDRPEEAIEALQQALKLNGRDAKSWFSLGLAHDDLGQLPDAETALRRAIELDAGFVEAHQNLATVLRAMGRYDDAIAAYDMVLAIKPDYETAISNRALALLAAGNFSDGWRQYQTRPSVSKFGERLHRDPLPADLAGQSILVLRDQGLGDEIYFLRFVRELAARNAAITYWGQGQITTIIERLSFLDSVLDETKTAPPEAIDLWVSAGDLPYLLGMNTRQDIPRSISLSAKPDLVADIRDRLRGFGDPPYLGVTWRAGTQKRNQLSKVAPADAVASALCQTTGTVIALQRNPHPGEIDAFSEKLGRTMHDLTALNNDLEEMLALLDSLDDYVCVSNTNVHLREGLGKTSQVLVPHPADYRWMDSGDESPWFPGTRIYRETYETGWDKAFDSLTATLVDTYGNR
jgi:tetratricopeptide (TPR) repeat protein